MAEPRNLREKARVESELRRKYPQMYNKDGSLKKAYGGKKKAKRKKKKKYKTMRTKQIEKGVGSNLTKSELDRFR